MVEANNFFENTIRPLAIGSISYGAMHALQYSDLTTLSPLKVGLTTMVYTLAHKVFSKVLNKMFQTSPSSKGYHSSLCYIIIQLISAGTTILMTHYVGILSLASFTAYTSIELLIYLKTVDYCLVSSSLFSTAIERFVSRDILEQPSIPNSSESCLSSSSSSSSSFVNQSSSSASSLSSSSSFSSASLSSFSSVPNRTISPLDSSNMKTNSNYPWSNQTGLTFHFLGFPIHYTGKNNETRYFSHYDKEENTVYYPSTQQPWFGNDEERCNNYGVLLEYTTEDGTTWVFSKYDKTNHKPIYINRKDLLSDDSSTSLSSLSSSSTSSVSESLSRSPRTPENVSVRLNGRVSSLKKSSDSFTNPWVLLSSRKLKVLLNHFTREEVLQIIRRKVLQNNPLQSPSSLLDPVSDYTALMQSLYPILLKECDTALSRRESSKYGNLQNYIRETKESLKNKALGFLQDIFTSLSVAFNRGDFESLFSSPINVNSPPLLPLLEESSESSELVESSDEDDSSIPEEEPSSSTSSSSTTAMPSLSSSPPLMAIVALGSESSSSFCGVSSSSTTLARSSSSLVTAPRTQRPLTPEAKSPSSRGRNRFLTFPRGAFSAAKS